MSTLCAPVFAPQAQAQTAQAEPQAEAQQTSQISQALARLANPVSLFSELQPAPELTANYPAEQARVTAVLAGEDFHRKETRLVHHWRWDWQGKPAQDPDRAHWEQLIAITARALEVLLWALALAFILWLAFNYRKLLARFGALSQEGKTPVSPQMVFGLDVRPASLPSNPAEAALQLCAAGDYRQGLALLYRATLVALIQQGLQLKTSHTEEDCLARANSGLNLPAAARDYLQLLTRTWQQLAYGHLPPSRDLAEQLCRNWPNHWAVHRAVHGATHSAINEAAHA